MLLNMLLGHVMAQHLRDSGAEGLGPTNDGSRIRPSIVHYIASSYWLPVLFSIQYGEDTPWSLRLPSEKRQLSSIWIG